MEPTGKQGGEAGAPMSLFSNDLPSRMLLGIDPARAGTPLANVIQQWCQGLNNAAAEVERTVKAVTPAIPIETPMREAR